MSALANTSPCERLMVRHDVEPMLDDMVIPAHTVECEEPAARAKAEEARRADRPAEVGAALRRGVRGRRGAPDASGNARLRWRHAAQ